MSSPRTRSPLALSTFTAALCVAALGLAACGDDKLAGDTTDAPDTLVPDTAEPDTDTAEPEIITFDTFVPDTATDTSVEPDVVAPSCSDRIKPFYCPCDINDQCESGYCIATGESDVARRCSRTCQDACPNGWECKGVGGGDPVFICQPPVNTLCVACAQDADCQTVGARCVTFPDGKYCGKDCQNNASACPTGYACDEIENDVGQIIAYQCVRTSGSCNCPDGTDYNTDPANCAFCGNACTYFHGIPGCAAKICKLDGCENDWKNLNQEASDGCEYRCTFTNANDWPDAACNSENDCDQNCDGIDGDYARAIFVAPNGTRGASGAPYDPLPSIGEALQVAGGAKDHIYVAAGTYNESITLKNGVSIFGGYSNDGKWVRNLSQYTTTITSSSGVNSIRVVIADGINQARTVLDGVRVEAGSNASPSGSSYAIWVKDSSDLLELVRVSAVGGNGGAGAPGSNGNTGSEGAVGTKGKSSSENSGGGTGSCSDCGCDEESQYGGPGGAGAPNSCGTGRNSGGGGGGSSRCGSGNNGNKGSDSPSGAAGGPAGNGNKGSDGSGGGPGSDGSGGNAQGSVSGQGFWQGSDGGGGGTGINGVGGGGGSGGAGSNNGTFDCASWGGGGGGGGSGGCGGTGATGGRAGGGSFGLFLYNASPKLVASAFGHKNGGNGGSGGSGGGGGSGKEGGAGGSGCFSAGAGGKGGTGGGGGRGGHGGGGGGGLAFGVYIVGSSDPICDAIGFSPAGAGGTGGLGGPSSANRGADGGFGDKNVGTARCP